MILPGMPRPLAMKASASDLYSIISGGDEGFVKEGGVWNGAGLSASGSDQGILLDGFVVDAVTNRGGFNLYFQGDATSAVSGLSSVFMNEDEFFVSEIEYLISLDLDVTEINLGSEFPFVDGVTYTMELVFA